MSADTGMVRADEAPLRLKGRGLIGGVAEIKTEIVRRTQAAAIEKGASFIPMERDLTPSAAVGVSVITGALLFGGDSPGDCELPPDGHPGDDAQDAVQVLVLGGPLLAEGAAQGGEAENVYGTFVLTAKMADHLLAAVLKMRADHHELICQCGGAHEAEPEPAPPGSGGYL